MTLRRIAIIGCGYVGSAVGEALAGCGHDVIGTTTRSARCPELKERGITPQVVEVADVDRLRELLADRETVLLTIAPKQTGADYRKVYLAGAQNLLTAAGTGVRQIIYTSSTSVYGQEDGGWVDESSETNPTGQSGQILLDTERLLLGRNNVRAAATGQGDGEATATEENARATTVVRLSGIYGPGRDPARRALKAAGTEREDGDTYVNLIHLNDIVAALTALLDQPYHGVLNLSDNRPTLRRDFYDRVLEEANLPPIRWRPTEMSPRRGKKVCNELIKETLGLTLQHPTH